MTFFAIWMPTVPRLPPAPMIRTVSPHFSSADVQQEFTPWHVAQHHCGAMKIDVVR